MSTYVVAGFAYFVAHPSLWVTAMCPILMTIVVALVSVVVLFTIGLYPQAIGLEHVGVPAGLAWLLAVILVILEIFLVTLIYSLTCLPCFADKIFAQVLQLRGFGELVSNEARHSGCCRVCAACCRVSLWLRLVVLIATMPLNIIPILGTVVWVWLNGFLLAWEYHLYYFELKGYSYVEQRAVVKDRRLQYSSFGMQAMFLELIPFFGSLFIFTNTVGAARFAADMEEEQKESQSYWDSKGNGDLPVETQASPRQKVIPPYGTTTSSV
ncbi:TPA: hypothetical protein N0F65_003104 [Lagenidium giganteum]|uniref:Uncharacterized protein n=1 Tax=Lagenidium giganteum TaxID=4803 RepID=A0AAV2YWB2_9STRA|nr:TPA: hypothetical protein N0F65_003104 [Lagenidium giganteum]